LLIFDLFSAPNKNLTSPIYDSDAIVWRNVFMFTIGEKFSRSDIAVA